MLTFQRIIKIINAAEYMLFVLDSLLLTTDKGEYKMATFLDDHRMSQLFEKFVLGITDTIILIWCICFTNNLDSR